MPDESERYLVLCVDRDDDLGAKAKVATPVIGREAVLAAATSLALADPEEADANAIFSSVRKYDELLKAGTLCEVAVVCGDPNRGFEADRRVGKELSKVLGAREYAGVVLVTDGGEDEQVIPIIQSMRPIVSVQRVTVKHSQTVEETYQVLARYLRMLVFDPHYSKWSLGVPGLIFILVGVLIVTQHAYEAGLAALLVLGAAFFIRGFGVDRTVAGVLQRGPTGYIRLFTMVASFLIVLAGAITGYGNMVEQAPDSVRAVIANPGQLFVYGATLAGYLLNGALGLIWTGIAIYAIGALLSHIARDSVLWKRDGFLLAMLAILYLPVRTFTEFLIRGTAESTFLLISYVLIGLAAIFALTTTIYPKVRTRTAADAE